MDSSQKLTNTDVKKLNKNRIFRLIYNSDKISRQEIADRLGLSLPTVNQNLKMLMEDGLIEYVGNFTSTGGRRAQAITINNNARKAISVNIKADYINVDVVGLKGQIIYSMDVKAHFSKSSAYIEKLTDAVRHAADYVGADADDILGVGITVPGILDDEKQILISAPPLKAKNYDFAKLISAIDYPVVVMNDARAEAYADHWFNGKPEDEKIYIMLGEGVGGAYINSTQRNHSSASPKHSLTHNSYTPDILFLCIHCIYTYIQHMHTFVKQFLLYLYLCVYFRFRPIRILIPVDL